MIGALLGFVAPFLPDLLNIGKSWLDNAHERKMMDLRLQHAEKAHDWRMEEIDLKSSYEDVKSARDAAGKPGGAVRMLEAARGAQGILSKWVFSAAFFLYTLVDLLSATVRPVITYYLAGLYGAIKGAVLYGYYTSTGSWVETLTQDGVWTYMDMEIFMTIIAFWFGNRVREKNLAGKGAR